ncbi:hypothetical protein JCM5353_008402 [Sporobolomyces roseus]
MLSESGDSEATTALFPKDGVPTYLKAITDTLECKFVSARAAMENFQSWIDGCGGLEKAYSSQEKLLGPDNDRTESLSEWVEINDVCVSPIRFDDKIIWEKQAHLVDPSETCLSMPIEFFDSTRPGQNRVYVDKQVKYGSISDGLHFARRLYLAPSLRQRTYKDHKPSDTPHIVWEVRFASLFTPSYLLDMGELGSWS